MAGKWIDLFIIIAFAIAIWRGFRRGIIREIFSLFGVLLAVAIGFYRHEELSLHLMARFPLGQGAALLIAFLILVIGISLVAKFIGYLWGKSSNSLHLPCLTESSEQLLVQLKC